MFTVDELMYRPLLELGPTPLAPPTLQWFLKMIKKRLKRLSGSKYGVPRAWCRMLIVSGPIDVS